MDDFTHVCSYFSWYSTKISSWNPVNRVRTGCNKKYVCYRFTGRKKVFVIVEKRNWLMDGWCCCNCNVSASGVRLVIAWAQRALCLGPMSITARRSARHCPSSVIRWCLEAHPPPYCTSNRDNSKVAQDSRQTTAVGQWRHWMSSMEVEVTVRVCHFLQVCTVRAIVCLRKWCLPTVGKIQTMLENG